MMSLFEDVYAQKWNNLRIEEGHHKRLPPNKGEQGGFAARDYDEEILNYLRNNPDRTIEGIHQYADIPYNPVQLAIKRLKQDGKIIATKKGSYCLYRIA